MAKSKGSAPKPGSPEWQDINKAVAEHDAQAKASGADGQTFEIAPAQEGKAQWTVRAFGQWLRSVWVADLLSEPEPLMSGAVLAGVRAGGA